MIKIIYQNDFDGSVYGNRLCAYTWVPGDINHNQIVKEFSDEISLTSPELYRIENAGTTDRYNIYLNVILYFIKQQKCTIKP